MNRLILLGTLAAVLLGAFVMVSAQPYYRHHMMDDSWSNDYCYNYQYRDNEPYRDQDRRDWQMYRRYDNEPYDPRLDRKNYYRRHMWEAPKYNKSE